jgi:hypothetical protein
VIRRFSAVVALSLMLAACGWREKAALEGEVQRLRGERDKLAKIAEHHDEYREELARLAKDLERTVVLGCDLDHAKRIDRIAAMPGITRKPASSGGTDLSGTSRETFLRARREGGSIAVERFTVDASGAWTLTVPAYDHSPYEGGYGVHIPPPTPPPGRFAGRRSRALRNDIEALQREIAELLTLVGDVSDFEAKKRLLAERLGFLDRPSRLIAIGRVTEPLFEWKSAGCRSGSVTVTNDNVRFWCAPRAADADAGVEALRAVFAEPTEIGGWSLGPISIDPSNPEPIQGALLRKK